MIGDIICGLLVLFFHFLMTEYSVSPAQKPPTKLSTSAPTGNRSKRLTENRDALRNCSLDGCSALTFRSSDYCLRHRDEKPLEQEADANWWEEGSGE